MQRFFFSFLGAALRRPPLWSFIIALTTLITFYLVNRQLPQIIPVELPEETFIPAEEYEPPPLPIIQQQPPQAEPEAPPPKVWLEYRIRRNDTMERILNIIKTDGEMSRFLRAQQLKSYRRLRPGEVIYFREDDGGYLVELLYKTSPDYYLTAGRDADGNLFAKEEAPETTSIRRTAAGIIDSSLFAAADAAGMSNLAINKLIEALETQIDFYREVRKGDTFRVIYNEWHDDSGEIVKTGMPLAFEYNSLLSTRPRLIRGVYYENSYYAPDGTSLARAFLPAPLKYRRISSKFTHRRFHPVLKRWRPHRGVDYAAPSGTPVRSTADGVVTKVERQSGYGNVVMIKHFNIYTTVYAHLRGFAKGIRRGSRVTQGQEIGYVGQTGLATGPHLHYEMRVRGKYKDPLSVELPKQLPPLKGDALTAFQAHYQDLWLELDTVAQR